MLWCEVFFEDELVRYDPPEFYQIEIIKTRGKGKKKEYFVHYKGWPNIYDEWKTANEMKHLYLYILLFNKCIINKHCSTSFFIIIVTIISKLTFIGMN